MILGNEERANCEYTLAFFVHTPHPVMAGLLRSDEYEPMRRIGHTSWQMGGKALVHGGVTKDYSGRFKTSLAFAVETFDAYTELWQQSFVAGETPASGVFMAASASVNGDLFMFGGYDAKRCYNSLHRPKRTLQRFKVLPQNKSKELPMKKAGA